jgi:predicted deacylase
VDLPVSVLSDHTPVTLSVHVVHGRRPGPTLFVSAAVHGDEVIGVEIVRRLLRVADLDDMAGTLLAVPIVNAFGFMNHSRYLPDRRDLNRTFPGSPTGSLAARLAHLFFNEVVCRSDVGVDLHSAAINRTNLAQIRVSPGSKKIMALAETFGAPVILVSQIRPGSLRHAAEKKGIDVLLYEAGEGLRLDEHAVRTGVSGILRVMQSIEMVHGGDIEEAASRPVRSSSSTWLRAPIGGLLRTFKTTGSEIAPGDVLGIISDPFGDTELEVTSDRPGLIVGRTNLPIVNEGDGLFHIARVSKSSDPEATIESLAEQLGDDPIFDEDEII